MAIDPGPSRMSRPELPNLYALNFVIRGLLGEGVASSARTDPQAKTLAEYFRARVADLPRKLLPVDAKLDGVHR